MGFVQEEEEAPSTLDYPPCFHFRQLWSQKWKKTDAAQTIKLQAEPLIVAEKESSVTTATEGREGRDGELRGERDGHCAGWIAGSGQLLASSEGGCKHGFST